MAQDVPFQWTKIATQGNEMTENKEEFGWKLKYMQ